MRVRAGLLAVVALLTVGTTGGCADGDGQPSGVPHPKPTRPALAPDRVDFNGDGVRDTVKGHPDATVEHARRAGTVAVTYGSRSGKADKDSGSADPQQRTLREGHDGLPEQAEPNDRFGAGLLTGDLDGDGCTDLVVNAPGESWDGQLSAGRSMILWGSRHGLSGATLVDRGSAAAYNAFAFMAIGDFNADGHPDLVSPAGAGESSGSHARIYDRVLYGPFKRSGKAAGSSHFGPRISDTAWLDAPVAGDFDDDGADDLVAILNYDNEETGLIMFNGSRTHGLTGSGSRPSGPDYPSNLTTSDLNRDGHPDLVVTTPGSREVLYGRRGGLSRLKP
ncbi:FG-GAP repeat protein [Streptomyces sp. NPDC057284]|uniref:FG-GAP repeat protein n=1 Tax=Streptomyces sp. NPDC057284 TaxID=3346083 RepID=UPI00363805F3